MHSVDDVHALLLAFDVEEEYHARIGRERPAVSDVLAALDEHRWTILAFGLGPVVGSFVLGWALLWALRGFRAESGDGS